MTAYRPGDVIDGTPEDVEAVLREAPMGTVLSDRDADLWRRQHGLWVPLTIAALWTSKELAGRHGPLTVLRWGHIRPALDRESGATR